MGETVVGRFRLEMMIVQNFEGLDLADFPASLLDVLGPQGRLVRLVWFGASTGEDVADVWVGDDQDFPPPYYDGAYRLYEFGGRSKESDVAVRAKLNVVRPINGVYVDRVEAF